MKYAPKFEFREANSEEEKNITELVQNLHDLTKAHIKLSINNLTDIQIFNNLRDSAIAYACQTMLGLTNIMALKKEKFLFLKESQDLFNKYIEKISGEIE